MFKDTKEGQTHSYNDGCGEPAHNQNPILKAHLEGVEMFKKSFVKDLGPMVEPVFLDPNGSVGPILAFLTSYGTNLLKAAKEAGPKNKEQTRFAFTSKEAVCTDCGTREADYHIWPCSVAEAIIFNSCLSSLHSAIDEGIKDIKNN